MNRVRNGFFEASQIPAAKSVYSIRCRRGLDPTVLKVTTAVPLAKEQASRLHAWLSAIGLGDLYDFEGGQFSMHVAAQLKGDIQLAANAAQEAFGAPCRKDG